MKQYLSSSERRERTVETVIELCAKQDPATLTTDRIARHMRVTQGALFRHFPNKEAIWEAVVSWVGDRILGRVIAPAEEIEDPMQALEAMFLAHVEFISRHPGIPRVLIGQLQQPRSTPAQRLVRSLLEKYRQRLVKLLQKARESGDFRRGLDPEAAAIQFIGTLQGLVLQSLIAGDVKRIVGMAPAAFDIYLHGICAGKESG